MLTPSDARAKNRINPILLFDITLLNGGGAIYLSDRNILVGSTQYQKYILNAPEITDAVRRDNSKGNTPSVRIKFNNKLFRTYGHLSLIENDYPIAGSNVIIKQIYLDDDNVQSTAETIFQGTFEEIKRETKSSFGVIAMSNKTSNTLKQLGKS